MQPRGSLNSGRLHQTHILSFPWTVEAAILDGNVAAPASGVASSSVWHAAARRVASTTKTTKTAATYPQQLKGPKKKAQQRFTGRPMKLLVSLARRGLLTPSSEKVEGFLRTLALTLDTGDVRAFEVLRRKMPLMGTVQGFLVDVVPIVSRCLHSRNRSVVMGALGAIDEIVSQHGRRLSTFSLTRMLNDLLLFDKADGLTYVRAKGLFFKMIEVNHNYTLYPLERLMAVCSEEMQLEIVFLLLEHVMSTKRVNRVIVTDGCRIALEGLFSASPRIRFACLDLVYALFYRGTPREALLRFFVKRRVPEPLLGAVCARLRRRYKPPLLSAPYAPDEDILWAQYYEGHGH
ncbi:hypothetical protein V5799_022308 [Amblyomma americanum]|uniref:Uncharacterized protein n=1 Tax=Amblyomma americanum TaxID=6943 RepID=A0AAQ4FL16_AMBAM